MSQVESGRNDQSDYLFIFFGKAFNQAEKFSSSPHESLKKKQFYPNEYTTFQKRNLFHIRKIFDIIYKICYYTSKMKR